jgi:hypothetical protein
MAGERLRKTAENEVLGSRIGLCDEVDFSFEKDLTGLEKIFPEKRSRLLGDILRRIQIY